MMGIEHILGSLEPLIHSYGSLAVTVILTFESFGVPLPGESLLIVAAVLAGRGEISVLSLILSAWAGAVMGDNIGYLIGHFWGRSLVTRYGAHIGLGPERLGQVEAAFKRYGPLTVGFARFVAGLRQLNGIVAGMLRMDWRHFLLFNALGGVAWVLAWVLAGYFLGTHVEQITALAHALGWAGLALAAAAALALGFLWLRHRATP